MEDVPTGWNLANFHAIVENLHADDALSCVELVNVFVILLELNIWN